MKTAVIIIMLGLLAMMYQAGDMQEKMVHKLQYRMHVITECTSDGIPRDSVCAAMVSEAISGTLPGL